MLPFKQTYAHFYFRMPAHILQDRSFGKIPGLTCLNAARTGKLTHKSEQHLSPTNSITGS